MDAAVFMFHAIGELAADDWADQAYSFSLPKFTQLLANGQRFQSIEQARASQQLKHPVLTFDDGHISNYAAGLQLSEQQCSADFFVNPALVGNAFYMSWSQLRELKSHGHSIQSHGLDHQFLSLCDDAQLQRQLLVSKTMIEQELGSEVTLLAPPGGRYDRRCVTYAQQFGYQAIAHSAPGHWRSLTQFLIPRIPVMSNNSVEILRQAQTRDSTHVRKLRAKYWLTGLAKNVLGDLRYDRLRNRLMS